MENEEKAPEIQIDSYRLFLDTSSSCTGYVVARIDKGGSQNITDATCKIVRAGAIWFPTTMENTQKYAYMYRLITEDFYVISAISDIVYERYSFSPDQKGGCLVVPEMIGAIKAATYDVSSLPLGIEDITPGTWRMHIGLKPIITPKVVGGKTKKSRDYKTPCIKLMRDKFGDSIPDKIISNVTGNERNVPHDVFDALGVCMGWHMKLGVTNFEIEDIAFNTGLCKVMNGDI